MEVETYTPDLVSKGLAALRKPQVTTCLRNKRWLTALLALVSFLPALQAHHLGNIVTSIFIDPSFLPTMSARAATNGPMLVVGDEFNIIMKATPDPAGTLTGVGGYQTFYIPNGMQVTGAIEMQFSGDPGTDYVIETTDDMLGGRWEAVGKFRSDPLGQILFHQPITGTEPLRFYRALRP